MKRIFIHSLILIGIISLLGSCHTIYNPTVINEPLIDGKGHIQASGHAGSNGVELQGAGSPADNIVLLLNYNSYTPEDDRDTTEKPLMDLNVLELGAGYYQRLDHTTVVELIGGYGQGNFENNYPNENNTFSSFKPKGTPIVKASYHKFFLQPSLGFHHDIYDLGFTSRLSLVDHYDIEEWVNGGARKAPYDIGGDLFWEPGITVRVGYKLVKFQSQIGISWGISGSPGYLDKQLWFSIGLHIDLEPDYF